MVVIFIALFITVFCFNFFMISYQMNGINHLIYSVPLSLFETSINLLNLEEDTVPYFSKENLENKLTSYFSYGMQRYVNDYKLDFYYYNPSNHSFCTTNKCSAVEVTLKTELMLNYLYEKIFYYEIRGN